MGMNYLSECEVIESARRGNRIAAQLARGKRPKHNAAIRHALAINGIHSATSLACRLLNMTYEQAQLHIEQLQGSRPDDIVSPYYT